LSKAEFQSNGLINLAEKISRQQSSQAAAQVLLLFLAMFTMKIESNKESIKA
jgi:hypothetical protein